MSFSDLAPKVSHIALLWLFSPVRAVPGQSRFNGGVAPDPPLMGGMSNNFGLCFRTTRSCYSVN